MILVAELDSFLNTSLKFKPASVDGLRTPALLLPKNEVVAGPVDGFRSEGKLQEPAGRVEVKTPVEARPAIEVKVPVEVRAPQDTKPVAPEPKADLLAPQGDWVLSGSPLKTEKKTEVPLLGMGGDWLMSGPGTEKPADKPVEKRREDDLAVQGGLIASLNLPKQPAVIEAATGGAVEAPGPELSKLGATLGGGIFGGGMILEASKTAEAAAALLKQQNEALTTEHGRSQYAAFLESARDDAELGKLYGQLHARITPDIEAEHLKLVAADAKTSAAQLGLVDGDTLKKAAGSTALGAALAAVSSSALGCVAGVAAVAAMTEMAAKKPETAADLTGALASAAQSEGGRKSLETLYGGIASHGELVKAQAKLDLQAVSSEAGREAVVKLQTGAAQSSGLASQMVAVQSKTQVQPEALLTSRIVADHVTLATSSLSLHASAAATEAGRTHLAGLFDKLAQDPEKASLWARTQSQGIQDEHGLKAFRQLHEHLSQDKVAGAAYTAALAAADAVDLAPLFGGAGRDGQASSNLLGTINQAPAQTVRDLVVRSGSTRECSAGFGEVFGAAVGVAGGTAQVGRLMAAVQDDAAASTAALRVINAGPSERIVVGLSRDKEASAHTTAALATAIQEPAGRLEARQFFTAAAENQNFSTASVRLLNAGSSEDVRRVVTGAAQDKDTAAALGGNLVTASRDPQGVRETGLLMGTAAGTVEGARSMMVVINAPGPESTRELTANVGKVPEAATGMGTVVAVAARDRLGALESARWLDACSETPEAARSALVVVNAAGPELTREFTLNMARQPETAASLGTAAAVASRDAQGARESGRWLDCCSETPEAARSALVVVNAAGPELTREFTLNMARQPETAASLGTAAAVASRDAQGALESARWLDCCSGSPESATAGLTAINAAGPELARELVVNLRPAGGSLGRALAEASRLPEGVRESAQLLSVTAETRESARAVVRSLNAAGDESTRVFVNNMAGEPKAAAAMGGNLVQAARDPEFRPELGRLLEATGTSLESSKSLMVSLEASGKSAEFVANVAQDGVASQGLNANLRMSSRDEDGARIAARVIGAAASTEEGARAVLTVINSAGPEKARELNENLAKLPEAKEVLNRAVALAGGPEADKFREAIAAVPGEGGGPAEMAVKDGPPGPVPDLRTAGPEDRGPGLILKQAADSGAGANQEPVPSKGAEVLPGQNAQVAKNSSATIPAKETTVQQNGAETTAVFAKAAQTVEGSAQALSSLARQSPERRLEILENVVREGGGQQLSETISKAPARAVSELVHQVASDSPKTGGALLSGLSQAPTTTPWFAKASEEPQTARGFYRMLQNASPEVLAKFLGKATEDSNSSEGLLRVLEHSESQQGLAKSLSRPEMAQALVKAAGQAPVVTVAGLTERIAQGKLSSTAFVKVVAQAPMESVRGMMANFATDAGASSSFVKVLTQAPPAAVQVLISRVVSDQGACESLVQALTVAASTPEGRAAVLNLHTALGPVLAQASRESTHELRRLLAEVGPLPEKKQTVTTDKAAAAGALKVPATTGGAQTTTKKVEATGSSEVKVDMGNAVHNRAVGRYKDGERIPGQFKVNVVSGGKTVKHSEETEESEGIQEVKKADRHRSAQNAAPVEEIQAIQLFERGQKRGHSCSRCGAQFEGRVASCPNCQGEMLELLAVNSVSYKRAGFTISTQTDLVEVTVAARNVLDTDKSSIAGLRSPQRFVTLRDLLSNCQAPVTGYATVSKTRTRRPKFD